MSTVALLGTSADPPTCGHRALLEGLLGRFPIVATWASDNPLKHHTAPLALRTGLLRTLVEAIGDHRLSLRQELSSPWAVETLARARRHWPGHELVFIVGSDLAAQVPGWKRGRNLLTDCTLGIVPRQGFPLHQADLDRLTDLGGRVRVLPLQIPASASSQLRDRTDVAQVPRELWPLLLPENPYGLSPP